MARPREGLGDAFSLRLPHEMDTRARNMRSRTGRSLSDILRTWLKDYERLKKKERKK